MKATLIALTCIVTMWRIVAVSSLVCGGSWFGDNCRYKCRCSRGSCNKGMCTANDKCQAGWFGEACQYIDMAYNAIYVPEMKHRGSGSTCEKKTNSSTVTIRFREPFIFTWLRLHFASEKLRNVTVVFNSSSGVINCGNRTNVNIPKYSDIFCDLDQTVEVLVLSGHIEDLCSVEVSGGRNLALRQHTWQSSNSTDKLNASASGDISFPAEKAVDGDANRDFYEGNTCTQAFRGSDELVSWNLTFSRAVLVDRYVLFMPTDSWNTQWGLTLTTFNTTGHTVFTHDVTSTGLLPVYTIVGRAHNVASVTITSEFEILELCEVEVYGDSECNVGYFGRDCEQLCHCADELPCTVNSGRCPNKCAPGFRGDKCNSLCQAEHYGQDCRYNCSKLCKNSTFAARSCNSSTGDCLFGCVSGYLPPMCSTNCPFGTYGPSCSSLCSSTCLTAMEENETECDAVNGTCLWGCLTGFIGANCSTKCPAGWFGVKCEHSCSAACNVPPDNNRSRCDFTNGTCMYGCEDGYTGPQCFTQCEKGSYGPQCLLNCSKGCAAPVNDATSSCDSVNGTCVKGCTRGYSGLICDMKYSVHLSSFPVGKLVAIGIGSSVALFLIATAAAFLIRRKDSYSPSDVLSS